MIVAKRPDPPVYTYVLQPGKETSLGIKLLHIHIYIYVCIVKLSRFFLQSNKLYTFVNRYEFISFPFVFLSYRIIL